MPENKITYLDGARLHRALVAGIREVISRQDYLNKINVFPVPDRDTGTNMALTLNAIIEATYTFERAGINELLYTTADAALNGARGNSGAILAQFFQGFYEGSKNVNQKMTTKNFVSAIATGVNFAHKALSEPKEGTILTVLRDFSDGITSKQLEKENVDYTELLCCGLERANESLLSTTKQLKSLKKAGVVDAGAQGFVDLLHGIYEFILNGSILGLDADESPIVIETSEEDVKEAINEKYRYCTECLIKGENINHDELRHELDELGNSLIVAGSKIKTKIHMHVNGPTQVFEICRKYGDISGEKADDMIHQQHSFNHREGKVAILTDSGADLPEGMISKLDIHVVPILINFGEKNYLDKVSMSPAEFYNELASNPSHPKTSQPSFGDFYRQYQYLNSHYDSTIALHIPSALSGTYNASNNAAKKCANKDNKITVVDTLNATAGMGLIVRYAAEAAQAGLEHDEIIEKVNTIITKTQFYVAFPDLNCGVKGGRISEGKKKVADFLNLTPLLHFSPAGKVDTASLFFGRKNLAKKIAKFSTKVTDKNKIYRFVITHSNNIEGANALEEQLQTLFPNADSIHTVPCGAAMGVHAGPGALGLAIQEYVPIIPSVKKEEPRTMKKTVEAPKPKKTERQPEEVAA